MKSILIAALLMLVAGCGAAAPGGSDSTGSADVAGAAGAASSASAGSSSAGSANPNSDMAGAPSSAGAPAATQELPESPNLALTWTVKQCTSIDVVHLDVTDVTAGQAERVVYSTMFTCGATLSSGLFLAQGAYKVSSYAYGPSFLESFPVVHVVTVDSTRVASPSGLAFSF